MQIDFDQYVDGLFRFALSLTRDRHLAEDLTQECCLRAHQRQSQLQDKNKIKPWLFQIMHNLWKDTLKKKRPLPDQMAANQVLSANVSPQKTAIMREQHQHVFQLMQELPDRQRNALFLSVVEQFKNREIAELLGITENNVKATLSIARKTLREKLADSLDFSLARTRTESK